MAMAPKALQWLQALMKADCSWQVPPHPSPPGGGSKAAVWTFSYEDTNPIPEGATFTSQRPLGGRTATDHGGGGGGEQKHQQSQWSTEHLSSSFLSAGTAAAPWCTSWRGATPILPVCKAFVFSLEPLPIRLLSTAETCLSPISLHFSV